MGDRQGLFEASGFSVTLVKYKKKSKIDAYKHWGMKTRCSCLVIELLLLLVLLYSFLSVLLFLSLVCFLFSSINVQWIFPEDLDGSTDGCLFSSLPHLGQYSFGCQLSGPDRWTEPQQTVHVRVLTSSPHHIALLLSPCLPSSQCAESITGFWHQFNQRFAQIFLSLVKPVLVSWSPL